jgi:hypothetical protein
VNVLCKENYKSLKKEIEEDSRRWKDLPHSWIPKKEFQMGKEHIKKC